MTNPTQQDLDVMTAFLGGYIEEGGVQVITLPHALDLLRVLAPRATIDGMTVSRLLRRHGFNRSYLPADAGVITYRRNQS